MAGELLVHLLLCRELVGTDTINCTATFACGDEVVVPVILAILALCHTIMPVSEATAASYQTKQVPCRYLWNSLPSLACIASNTLRITPQSTDPKAAPPPPPLGHLGGAW